MAAPLSRRDLLTHSTTLAALGLTSAAGCTELDVLGGADTGLGAELGTWLPAPETFPGRESQVGHYYSWGADLTRIRSSPDHFQAFFRGPDQSRVDHLGIDVQDVDRMFSVSFVVTVLTGDFDADTVADSLRSQGLEAAGTVDDARVFEDQVAAAGPDAQARPYRLAVGDSYVVEMPLGVTELPPSTVGHLVETHAGDVQRYTEANSALDTLLDAQRKTLSISGEVHERVGESRADPTSGSFVGLVAQGTAVEVADDILRLQLISVFDDPDDVDREALDTYAAERARVGDSSRAPNYEHAGTTVDGRVARIVLETPIGDLPTPTSSR